MAAQQAILDAVERVLPIGEILTPAAVYVRAGAIYSPKHIGNVLRQLEAEGRAVSELRENPWGIQIRLYRRKA